MTERCDTCRFWRQDEALETSACEPGETVSICRRRAPPPGYGVTDTLLGMGAWPLTFCNGWCGEWEARR